MDQTQKTLAELGQIILDTHGAEAVMRGYALDSSDVEEIGRQALLWRDINADGSFN